jgi:hypothetical protein
MAVGDQRIDDATGLAKRLEEWKQSTGDAKLTVKTGDAPARSWASRASAAADRPESPARSSCSISRERQATGLAHS